MKGSVSLTTASQFLSLSNLKGPGADAHPPPSTPHPSSINTSSSPSTPHPPPSTPHPPHQHLILLHQHLILPINTSFSSINTSSSPINTSSSPSTPHPPHQHLILPINTSSSPSTPHPPHQHLILPINTSSLLPSTPPPPPINTSFSSINTVVIVPTLSIRLLHLATRVKTNNMATSLLGTVGPFEEGKEDWKCYCERLEQFFQANDITDEGKRRAVLLSVCGSSTYQLMRNLSAPEKPSDKTFSELVTIVRNHFCPPPSVTVQRYNFNCRVQKEGETVSQFVAELRKLSEHCEFGNTLEDMLRDRLVCGIRNARVQRRLLAESGLTFAKAFELTLAAELAEKNALDIQRPGDGSPIHTIQKQTGTERRPIRCSRCGGRHNASECRCKSIVCYNFGKQGHLARVCVNRRESGGARSGYKGTESHPDKEQPVEKTETYTLFNVTEHGHRAPLIQSLRVSGALLQMQVDTGAVASIISESTYKCAWSDRRRPALEESDVLLRTYTGERINVLGKAQVNVQYGSQHHSLTLLVVAGEGPSLMGRDWLSKIKPNLSVFYSDSKYEWSNY
ncbi:hypothetical protein EMCRGX_G029860 [Ephydatia muelleri]